MWKISRICAAEKKSLRPLRCILWPLRKKWRCFDLHLGFPTFRWLSLSAVTKELKNRGWLSFQILRECLQSDKISKYFGLTGSWRRFTEDWRGWIFCIQLALLVIVVITLIPGLWIAVHKSSFFNHSSSSGVGKTIQPIRALWMGLRMGASSSGK